MTARSLLALLPAAALVNVADAAVFTFQWEGGASFPEVNIGDTVTLEAYVTLENPGPPMGQDEMGLMFYVLFRFDPLGFDNLFLPASYTDPLDHQYIYFNLPLPGPPPFGLTGTEVRYNPPNGHILNFANTGGEPVLVSTVTLEAGPCDAPEGVDSLVFVNNLNTDLAMYRGDYVTPVPFELGTPGGIPVHHTCVPEPGFALLLAVGSLVVGARARRGEKWARGARSEPRPSR